MRLVIVGGVAAGTKAASRARRLDPEMEITIYQEEPEPSIGECGLPYFLSNVVEERERLVARTPEKFAENDIEVLVRHRVEKIDAHSKKLIVHDLDADKTFEDTYDRLIVATGSPPFPVSTSKASSNSASSRTRTGSGLTCVSAHRGGPPSWAEAISGSRSRKTCAASGWSAP
jgi:NADPH-dependent 2,4-dienoyl-CoA reductase/sulfur reductase-like enzyme